MDAWWVPALREAFAGNDVIIIGAVPPAWADYIEHLRTAEVGKVMIVATEGRGVGPAPDVPTVVVEPPSGCSMMERLRFSNDALINPPAEVLDALHQFDPDREAMVVGSFLNETAALDGRPVMSYRRPEWVALEDKTVIDEFWDRAGVTRLDSAVVPLVDAAAVAPTVDRGEGTVWAADNRDGFHGGGHGLRWVREQADRDRATADLGEMCDTVRVMPFVEGISCSIHGIVLSDGVAVLRPVEMVTLRRGRDLVYRGCATFWDPPEVVREQMRSVARKAAAQLIEDVDYRGAFTVDGVVGEDGFWPTELNPRFGAGLNVIARADGNIPMLLLHELAVAGQSLHVDASELERRLVDHADTHRAGGTWGPTSERTIVVEGRTARVDENTWSWGDPPAGTVWSGAGFARCLFQPDATPVGPSVGARAASFWSFADRELATEIGDLTPPPA